MGNFKKFPFSMWKILYPRQKTEMPLRKRQIKNFKILHEKHLQFIC